MAHSPKSNAPDPVNSFLDALFRGLWQLISYPFRDKQKAAELERTKAQFRSHWDSLASLDPRQAVLQADILLDQALQFRRVAGNSLGERLKAATSLLSKEDLNAAWAAHKLRNTLAHELNYQISPTEARQAMVNFRQALRALGVL